MAEHLPILIALLAAIALAGVIAPRLHLPLPVVLALGGIGLAFVPGLRRTPLDPDLILVAILPPVLYADAFDTSWVDFKRWMRPIVMLAVGLVAATTLAVGLVAHAILPELPWPVCFILGAVVSPTDTVAVQTVLERLRIPRRATAILGGESLVNDATGLVGVQLGVAVVLSGAFAPGELVMRFAWVAGGGVLIGLACGVAFTLLNRVVRGTQPLFALSLLAPYAAFALAHALGSSGVLAVVVAGFVVAWHVHQIAPESRVDLYSVWTSLVDLLNGVCFVFVGLETPRLLRDTALVGGDRLFAAALAVSATVVLTRMLWVFPGAYLPLFLLPKLRAREGGLPDWRPVVLAGWCGVRGAVSLAAALSLPALLPDGRPFPGRDAILACTICVILVTLFLQAPTLHPLVQWLGIREDASSEEETRAAREAIARAGIERLDQFCSERECPIAVHRWRELLADELATMREEDEEERKLARTRLEVSREVRRAVAQAQSGELLRMRDAGRINDNTYIALQLEIDREQLSAAGQAA
jgi:CPA1 family monovalent cation:H+ antiporter